MKTMRPVALAAVVLLTAGLAAGQSNQQKPLSKKIAWTFQGQADDTNESAWASEHRNFPKLVKDATKGRIELAYVSDTAPDTGVLDAVKAHKLNLGFMGVHYMPEMALMNFPSLPIVPNDRLPEILSVLKPQFDEIWQRQFGVKLLAFGYYLPQTLFTMQPADTVASLKDKRFRHFGASVIDLYTRAGVQTVAIANVHMVQQSLIDGKLDGAQGALPAYVNWGWAQKLKYVSNWPLGSVYMALVINLDDWNALTPELQQEVESAANQLEKRQWQGRQAYVNGLLKKAETDFGSKVVNPSPDEVKKLLENAGPVVEDWKQRVGPGSAEILAAINKVLGTSYE